MRYVVVLNPETQAGQAFLLGYNDGATTQGLPIIDCSQIDMSGPYLECTRNSRRIAGLDQTLLIPHFAVAYVIGYSKEEDLPFGFADNMDKPAG